MSGELAKGSIRAIEVIFHIYKADIPALLWSVPKNETGDVLADGFGQEGQFRIQEVLLR